MFVRQPMCRLSGLLPMSISSCFLSSYVEWLYLRCPHSGQGALLPTKKKGRLFASPRSNSCFGLLAYLATEPCAQAHGPRPKKRQQRQLRRSLWQLSLFPAGVAAGGSVLVGAAGCRRALIGAASTGSRCAGRLIGAAGRSARWSRALVGAAAWRCCTLVGCARSAAVIG